MSTDQLVSSNTKTKNIRNILKWNRIVKFFLEENYLLQDILCSRISKYLLKSIIERNIFNYTDVHFTF